MEKMLERVKADRWSWSFELCPKSHKNTGVVRGHLHVCVSFEGKKNFRLDTPFVVGAALPHHARFDSSRLSTRAKNNNAAHYYLQIHKATGCSVSQSADRRTSAKCLFWRPPLDPPRSSTAILMSAVLNYTSRALRALRTLRALLARVPQF